MHPQLSYQRFTLPNGLEVIVHEDHALPIVAVNLWYRVGSKNEKPGRTGFAHLFEHLMFEGSANAPEGVFDELLEAAGGENNGSTTPDRTNYHETLPSNAFELALWLEGDRMGGLLDAMTQEKLDGQRDVVKNERRQSYENRPYGLAYETILAALYPPEHPYSWPVIGSMADLDAASLEDVAQFFRTYYAPNNASLVVAGAVDTTALLPLVEKHFAHVPSGPALPPVTIPPAHLTADRELLLEDTVQLPRLFLVWHSPAAFAEGDAALELAAAILAEGKASRLYRTLVYERQVAQDVEAFQDGGELGSAFYVVATARPGVSLAELERLVREELARVAEDGVTSQEMERGQNMIETALIDGLQEVEGRADQLNMYAYYTGDPGYLAEDLARFRRVDAAAVQGAMQHYLVGASSVVLSVVPRGRADLSARAVS